MEGKFKSKYHREKPLRQLNLYQTMYTLMQGICCEHPNMNYAYYMGELRTYRQLISDTDALADALYKDGVRANDVVGVCLLTIPEVAPVLLALSKIGAVSCWMDASVKPSGMLHYICQHAFKVLIVFEPLLPIIMKIVSQTSLQRIIVVPTMHTNDIHRQEFLDKRFYWYDSYLLSAYHYGLPVAAFDREKMTIIVQSSGSTGNSKSIAHTDYNFNSAVEKHAYSDLPLYPGKRGLVCAPPWVIYGLVSSIYASMVLGCVTVFTTAPKEEMLYSHLGLFDHVFGVPVYYRYLFNKMSMLETSSTNSDIEELQRIRDCLYTVKVFVSGGDKIPEDELIAWEHTFGVPIVNGYGNNEVTGACVCSPLYANRPGSIGIPLYGTTVKTFSAETQSLLPGGELGELCIHTDTLFKEYLGKPEETAKIKRIHNGLEWVHTGDLAIIDADGFIFLKGRTRRLIIDRLGYKISPDNSENFIQSLPFVKECIVVGAEIAENDTVPMAFIELTDEQKHQTHLLTEIEDACNQNLKEYERPKLFRLVDRIPHKQNGGKQDFLLLEKMAKDFIEQDRTHEQQPPQEEH